MDLSFMPAVNASLNTLACISLIGGFAAIKARRVSLHRSCMASATVWSGLFLVCYVTHYVWRALSKGGLHTKYNGTGWLKNAYYSVLLSHIVLAITVPFLAVALIRFAVKGRYEQHRRLARVGFPIWMYVSVTGVFIYFMLYWFNPSAP